MDVTIEEYAGPHSDLAWSFREAEDSERLLDAYIAHLQAVPRGDGVWEVTNTAVAESHRGQGIGRLLLRRAVDEARSAGATRMVLATATADLGNLRFYQRCGFRMTHVVHDAFGPAQGYPPGLEVNGIPLLDQVWFECAL